MFVLRAPFCPFVPAGGLVFSGYFSIGSCSNWTLSLNQREGDTVPSVGNGADADVCEAGPQCSSPGDDCVVLPSIEPTPVAAASRLSDERFLSTQLFLDVSKSWRYCCVCHGLKSAGCPFNLLLNVATSRLVRGRPNYPILKCQIDG